jgi:hypothetical protein
MHSLEAASLLILDKAALAFSEAKSVFPNLTSAQAKILLPQLGVDENASNGKRQSETHISCNELV